MIQQAGIERASSVVLERECRCSAVAEGDQRAAENASGAAGADLCADFAVDAARPGDRAAERRVELRGFRAAAFVFGEDLFLLLRREAADLGGVVGRPGGLCRCDRAWNEGSEREEREEKGPGHETGPVPRRMKGG